MQEHLAPNTHVHGMPAFHPYHILSTWSAWSVAHWRQWEISHWLHGLWFRPQVNWVFYVEHQTLCSFPRMLFYYRAAWEPKRILEQVKPYLNSLLPLITWEILNDWSLQLSKCDPEANVMSLLTGVCLHLTCVSGRVEEPWFWVLALYTYHHL